MKSESKSSGLKKAKKIFGWLFLVSVSVFIMSSGTGLMTLNELGSAPGMPSAPNPTGQGMVIISSMLASIASLVGFVSTTVLNWKREKRAAISEKLEIEKKELEIEQMRREIAKSKNGAHDV